MTYQKLFYLKYKKGMSTNELFKMYPDCIDQVSQVALCDVPEETLREIICEKEELIALIKLKQKFSNIWAV